MSLPESIDLDPVIVVIRGHKVMVSSHLAEFYGMEVKSLMQAVKRNVGRIPDGFMFQVTREEPNSLRSQNVIIEGGWGQHPK